MSTPEVIYLISDDLNQGEYVWCDDPVPCDEMDPADAVKYIRADLVENQED